MGPIACFSYLVLYILEKTYLFYGYVMPPMYDERLSNDVLNKLQFAPLLFTIFGYWMVSSNQLISNEYLTPKTLSTDLYDPQHGYASIFSPKGWKAASTNASLRCRSATSRSMRALITTGRVSMQTTASGRSARRRTYVITLA